MKYSKYTGLIQAAYFLTILKVSLSQENTKSQFISQISQKSESSSYYNQLSGNIKDESMQITQLDQDLEKKNDDLQLLRDNGAFIGSFLSILITEIGDKTFVITAILATKYDKQWVFLGSFGGLFLMTLISCGIGKASLSFIDQTYIKLLASALFFGFGGNAIYEALANKIDDEQNEIQNNLKELQEKINAKIQSNIAECSDDLEYQDIDDDEPKSDEQNQLETKQLQQSSLNEQEKRNRKNARIIPNTFIATQTFIQTFLGEWGDRSQISTMAMSTSFNLMQVFVGCILGHTLCSYLAITGGKMLAEKFSERILTLIGGILFIIYGFLTLTSI
ncbi:transmembrane protein (macronuclear) [Tetrahymena thermophila SB210]|uniref:GDT1 family protein n=1 Tax=Tetrahymena thermophila (strain SB210) TaxID=312017 RepID=Q228Q4_TETTS|nr:transmembrane protein [Tetrahymena thermophila SB210]EAR81770.1 transmembrane protein [Tetrahymena thermophila SB210]|eukprot:XP_001029433.1 transmembrane protein [Tetrahymena thermophila SB210]